ncbi:MAG TPA: SIS domain-containing protein [Candidatus Angelobacter sp.]|nr:SIS domain-containing protein [Candidatus Angelobacter sp.]
MASIGKKQQKRPSKKSSLETMEEEIHNQIEDLPAFASGLRKDHRFRHLDPSNMIFTGSGDSFASSFFAHYLSETEAFAADPFELQIYPRVTKNKNLFITSVSGKTRANIQLARKVKGVAKKRVAITANPNSPLAKECDDVIQLRYRSPGILTSGTVSFSASLLAVASLIRRLPRLDSLPTIEKRAAERARSLRVHPGGELLFIGSGTGYALAMYAAFKIHEVQGLPAQYQHTEQLGHSQLFSLQENSDNLLFLAPSSDQKTSQVFQVLLDGGFHAYLLNGAMRDPILAALQVTFCIQHLALNLGKKMGLKECSFLIDRKKLALSSRLIY